MFEALLAQLIQYVEEYPQLISVLCSFLGHEAVLILAFLAGEGLLKFWTIFIFSLIGFTFIDIFYFFVAKIPPFVRLAKKIKFLRQGHKDQKFIEKFASKKLIILLPLTKFVYGTRMISIFYVSLKGTKFKKFFTYDVIATLIWVGVMLPLGYWAGQGLVASMDAVQNIEKIVSVTFISFFVILFLSTYLLPKIIKKLIKEG